MATIIVMRFAWPAVIMLFAFSGVTRADATRRFTPPEPIYCAGGVKR